MATHDVEALKLAATYRGGTDGAAHRALVEALTPLPDLEKLQAESEEITAKAEAANLKPDLRDKYEHPFTTPSSAAANASPKRH